MPPIGRPQCAPPRPLLWTRSPRSTPDSLGRIAGAGEPVHVAHPAPLSRSPCLAALGIPSTLGPDRARRGGGRAEPATAVILRERDLICAAHPRDTRGGLF